MPVGIHTPNPKENYFAHTPERLQHLSVGAIVENEHGEVLVLRLARIGNLYYLPTATHAPEKTLEDTVMSTSKRTGWQVKPNGYLGFTSAEFPNLEGKMVAKDTIWLRCEVVAETDRDPEDRDADAEVLWVPRQELIEIFRTQSNSDRPDLDQSAALLRL